MLSNYNCIQFIIWNIGPRKMVNKTYEWAAIVWLKFSDKKRSPKDKLLHTSRLKLLISRLTVTVLLLTIATVR